MEFTFYVPVHIIMGQNCIRKNAALLAGCGKKALIVTTPSCNKNGSLEDLTCAFESTGVTYVVCGNTPPNPDMLFVGELGRTAKANGCDMIVGLGGGSAMDAAKAAAVLAANDMPPEGVYQMPYQNKPLPVIAVPTTCGTGSEVTAVSVLTTGGQKKSFKSNDVIPKLAFLDARYLDTLPPSIMNDTAVDALSHAAEGYLMTDNWMSDLFAEKVFEFFGICKDALQEVKYTADLLERLLFMAMAGGLVIGMTGTSAVHAMGYPLTMQRDVPHGRACGVLLADYVEYCLPARREKIGRMLSLLGIGTTNEFKKRIKLLTPKEAYTVADLEKYTELCFASAISRANPVKMEKSDVLALYKKALL